MKVCKFGGTSVGTVERMKHVATLIKDATPKIVVLSATAGTTNHLEEIAANLFNREIEQAHTASPGWNSSSSNLPMGC